MHVLAALGDAAIAAIAVAAILLGVLLAARGPREKRAAGGPGGAQESAGTLLQVPTAAAPDAEPGFVGPEGTVVGHGPIRLGAAAPLGAGAPGQSAPVPREPDPEAEPEPEPEPEAEPAPVAPPQDATTPAPEPDVAPPAEEAPPQEAQPPAPKEPAWRVAARAANSAAHFRQGRIKLGGKPADRRKDP